ncbi:MAG: hypothetical protein JWO98_5448 [Frankiales bacterium]|nr:hypothetical protein [Frankiales bacterium]
MVNGQWKSLNAWFVLRVLKRPVRQQPRKACEHHAAGCYLCPREYCSGALNDGDDPDLTKPRSSSSGHCVYLSGANGGLGLRLRMSARGANDHYARQAAERGYSDISTREMWSADIDGVGDRDSLELPL